MANELRAALGLPRDAARRGIQSRGGGGEVPDVIIDGLPVHWECKHDEQISPGAALRQAAGDVVLRKKTATELPVVVLKRNGRPPTVWMYGVDVTVFLNACHYGETLDECLARRVDEPHAYNEYRTDEHPALSMTWAHFLTALATIPRIPPK